MRDWIQHAQSFPLAFAQVREDPLLDAELIQLLSRKFDQPICLAMIASGGCTAAFLASIGLCQEMTLIDFNAAQLALAKYKLELLQTKKTEQRLQLLGYQPMAQKKRREHYQAFFDRENLPSDIWGNLDIVARLGVDFCGRYEFLFSQVRDLLFDGKSEGEKIDFEALANNADFEEKLRAVFQRVFDLGNLVALFGEDATQNAVKTFPDHFIDQTLYAMRNPALAPANNPFLAQMLLCDYNGAMPYSWFEARAPKNMPIINYVQGTMIEALQQSPETSYQLIHLSNILDWLDSKQAKELYELCFSRLQQGGAIFIRQLNSTLDLQAIGAQFSWDNDLAKRLHAKDRSFFYPKLHVGFKI